MYSPPGSLLAQERNTTERTTPGRLPPRVMSAAVFVVTALLAAAAVLQSESVRRHHERALIVTHVRDYAHHLETYIARALSASYALAALVEVARGDVPDFDRVAARLLPLYPGASELLLAPDGVIQHVAPLRGNEKAIGLDLFITPDSERKPRFPVQPATHPSRAPRAGAGRAGLPAVCPYSWKRRRTPTFGDSPKSSCVFLTLLSPRVSHS